MCPLAFLASPPAVLRVVLGCAVAYLVGSLPFGYLAAQIAGAGDIRRLGSGNTGATNVARTLGPGWGLIVLILDVAKGALGAWIGWRFLAWGRAGGLLTGLLAVAGHNWPVFLGFRGGKGVAATFGMVMVVYPALALLSVGVFFLTVLLSRYVSLGSLVGSWSAFVATFLMPGYGWLDRVAVGLFALLITVRHRSNLGRLLSGTERKVDEIGRTRRPVGRGREPGT